MDEVLTLWKIVSDIQDKIDIWYFFIHLTVYLQLRTVNKKSSFLILVTLKGVEESRKEER